MIIYLQITVSFCFFAHYFSVKLISYYCINLYPQVQLKDKFTIPNALSFYRLLAFPVILYLALAGYEQAFAVLIVINLVTDVLDGFLARMLKQTSEFGAKIDSIADMGTYLLVFLGIGLFKWDDFAPHILSFGTFIGLLIVSLTLSLIKFGRFPSLHLYSWKIGGYIQGIFFVVLFIFGFYTPFYYIMITWGILAFLEHIVIQLIIPEMRSNAKGLYWVLKERQVKSKE